MVLQEYDKGIFRSCLTFWNSVFENRFQPKDSISQRNKGMLSWAGNPTQDYFSSNETGYFSVNTQDGSLE